MALLVRHVLLATGFSSAFARQGEATTPALGWSSWNFFGSEANEEKVLAIASKLVSTGLADLGFRYVNIDAGAYLNERDQKTMKIVPDPRKFPHGLRYLSDALHKMGLKFGTYTDLGDHVCGSEGPGSLGHYEQDAHHFAHEWQIDYLKTDFCGWRNGTHGLPPLNESCAAGALAAGYDLMRANMSIHAATAWCAANASCGGFTTEAAHAATCGAAPTTTFDVRFKSGEARPNGDASWSHWLKPEAGRVSYEPAEQYAHWRALGDALNATGRPIWFSICPHTPVTWLVDGTRKAELAYAPPPVWSRDARHRMANSILVEYANTWDEWLCDPAAASGSCGKGIDGGIITNIDSLVQLTNLSDSGPRTYWNDGDMLVTCNYGQGPYLPGSGMSLTEYRAHHSVWAILASPMLLSADLRTLDETHPECLALLLNADIVAVNQDQGGHAPRLVRQELHAGATPARATPPASVDIAVQVFARPLGAQPTLSGAGGQVAVVLLNRGSTPREIAVSWAELGVSDATTPLAVYDVITRTPLAGSMMREYRARVEPHDVAFVKLTNAQ